MFCKTKIMPSYNTLVNRTNTSGATHDYKFTKERSTYVSNYASGALKSGTNKIQQSTTYQPFYFLPDLPNGVDTLRLKSLTEVKLQIFMQRVIIRCHKRYRS